MSYGSQNNVVITWSVHAMLRGIGGIVVNHHTTGSAREATNAMIAWLESRDTTDYGVPPQARLWVTLSSDQLLAGSHEMQNVVLGLPADRIILYSVDWLRLVSRVDNWGSGGGP